MKASSITWKDTKPPGRSVPRTREIRPCLLPRGARESAWSFPEVLTPFQANTRASVSLPGKRRIPQQIPALTWSPALRARDTTPAPPQPRALLRGRKLAPPPVPLQPPWPRSTSRPRARCSPCTGFGAGFQLRRLGRGAHGYGGSGAEAAAPGSGGRPGLAARRLLPAGQVGARWRWSGRAVSAPGRPRNPARDRERGGQAFLWGGPGRSGARRGRRLHCHSPFAP